MYSTEEIPFYFFTLFFSPKVMFFLSFCPLRCIFYDEARMLCESYPYCFNIQTQKLTSCSHWTSNFHLFHLFVSEETFIEKQICLGAPKFAVTPFSVCTYIYLLLLHLVLSSCHWFSVCVFAIFAICTITAIRWRSDLPGCDRHCHILTPMVFGYQI